MRTQPNLSAAEEGRTVYLDYAATNPAAPHVVAEMNRYLGLDGVFGNPSSRSHQFGWEAEQAVEQARKQVAELIGASPTEIYWTSGATESINLAIKGVAYANADGKRHIVTSSLEHKAVIDTCLQLASKGYRITFLKPNAQGIISPEIVQDALTEDTLLVSLMHINNEVGTITDISAISEITCARGIVFHVDAAQSAARLTINAREIKADLISLSAHKMYGPKGVGALFVRGRRHFPIEPQMHGGDQERGIRSGTLPTHQIVGMGAAAQLANEFRHQDMQAAVALDTTLRSRLDAIEHSFFNGNQEHRIAGILNVGFTGVESESLMMALPNIAFSSGSACTSSHIESSHVLDSLGVPEKIANCSVRFSLGRYTTEAEIEFAALHIAEAVNMLRQLSTSWEEQRPSKKKFKVPSEIRHATSA